MAVRSRSGYRDWLVVAVTFIGAKALCDAEKSFQDGSLG